MVLRKFAYILCCTILFYYIFLDVSPGQLNKESYCQLEADAVAVDILNRLNIEGKYYSIVMIILIDC